MTEAWLVLDEPLLRKVAGNPNGSMTLPIPTIRQAEWIADPRALLKEILVAASGPHRSKASNFPKSLFVSPKASS
jgi:hypothetical protein